VLVRLTVSIHRECGAEHHGHDGRMGAAFAILWHGQPLGMRFTQLVRFGAINPVFALRKPVRIRRRASDNWHES
jgi:hypothetical protein